ncbi:Hypothetical predicted protein [Olea europaea subsp. europaea]|uniref:NYN domain-containing protein n=1 Tax=Olea europaea subsp. europaea TaxID=158383 RepID=A0A8S0U6G1_OLEEU|nr:Hypothetical predicted protein [Olea europaea subsp. europaea]
MMDRTAIAIFWDIKDCAVPKYVRPEDIADVPNGRKDAADKAILVDMFLFALDNCEPCSIMLISGAIDFAPALHILGQRGYTIIVVIPSGVNVSSSLKNAGMYGIGVAWPMGKGLNMGIRE